MPKLSEHLFSDQGPNKCKRIAPPDITVALTVPTRTEAQQAQKNTKPTQGILFGNEQTQQVGAVTQWRQLKWTEQVTASLAKRKTHLHFNLKCQTNMHSFALKGIPIIEQTDRQGIFLCLNYFPLVKNVYYAKWKFQDKSSLLGPFRFCLRDR